MSTVAFIFARGGSKGLPNKNVLNFSGKPLIAWSIEQALGVKRIDRLIVSTDSEQIAKIAESYGAEAPFIRPAELATDESPEILAWKHGLKYLKERDGNYPEVFLSIPATAPLRLSSDIDLCLDEFFTKRPNIVVTVSESHRNPYFNMLRIDSEGICQLAITGEEKVSRRQDSIPVYDMTTVCYVAEPEYIEKSNGILDGIVRAVHIPRSRSIDIDTMLDFEFAEFIFQKRGENNDQA
jgi:CMP-N-acetylneuraminic acid synthetase